MTDKQRSFIESLLKDRQVTEVRMAEIKERLATYPPTVVEASEIINELLSAPRLPKAKTAPKAYVDPPLGMHVVDGQITKVYKTRNGHTVAKVLHTHDDAATFVYAGKAGLKGLDESTTMSAGEAAKFGRTYGICVRCARHLTDERSIAVGYGSTCASNEGWHYPSMSEAMEVLSG